LKKLKRIIIVIFMLLLVFWGYVEIVNRNSKSMTYRQKVLKAVYPLWMWWGKVRGRNITELSNDKKKAQVSFYSLKGSLINGETFDFASLRGKKVLIVNTASDCGYTNQYSDLQKLSEDYSNKVVVIGFPANDFKRQEKGSDQEIAEFCKKNYAVSFPLMQKSVVIKGAGQNEVFKWLTDSSRNGWNDKPPSWNFTKFLVNEEGSLTNYFGSSISPLSKDVLNAINK
jgi:glutathione peroxidase